MLNTKTKDALDITFEEYKNHPGFEAGWETFKANADAAWILYNMRKETGLTQKAFAELADIGVDTIVQLEDTYYDGDAYSLLEKITSALRNKTECLTGKEQFITTEI